MNAELKKVLDNNGVLAKVDVEKNKECQKCNKKTVYKETDGFVPVFCPADCSVQLKAGYIPITVAVEIAEMKPNKNNLRVA